MSASIAAACHRLARINSVPPSYVVDREAERINAQIDRAVDAGLFSASIESESSEPVLAAVTERLERQGFDVQLDYRPGAARQVLWVGWITIDGRRPASSFELKVDGLGLLP